MANQKKIELELKRIENLRARIIRLLNYREKEISDIRKEFDTKVNKVYTLLDLANQKIKELGGKDIEENKTLNDLGIEWIGGETTREVPVDFIKLPEEPEPLDGLEILE